MPFASGSSRQAQRRRGIALAVAAAGVLLGAFVLLFLLANDAWVVIQIPNPPWNPEPGWPAFEARIAAVMAVCFALGAICAAFVYRLLGREGRWRANRDRACIDELESELKNVSRLLASSRDNS